MSDLNRVRPSETDPINSPPPKPLNSKHPHYPFPEPDYGENYKYEPDFQGPVRNRRCTDIICLCLFLAFLGGWAFVTYFAVSEGQIEKV